MNTRKVITVLFIIYFSCVIIQQYQKNELAELKEYWEIVKTTTNSILN